MIETCPILSLNVKILLFWAMIRHHNYRRYILIIPITLLIILQWLGVFDSLMGASFDTIIFNVYFSIILFSFMGRALFIISKRVMLENFMEWIDIRYSEILDTNSPEELAILNYYTRLTQRFSIINYAITFMICFAFVIHRLVQFKGILIFEIFIPDGLNITVTPYFEVVQTYQIAVPMFSIFYYIPYTNIFITCISFGMVQLKNLHYNLGHLGFNGSMISFKENLKRCVKLHTEIYNYVNHVNELFSMMSLVEFICFGIIICNLLYMLVTVSTIPQMLIIISAFVIILIQLFMFYYASDKLVEEGYKVGFAAYSSRWYTFDKSTKQIIYLMMLRSQKPLQIMIGKIYPMSLVQFQAILNTSYSYFTILKNFK